MLWGFFKKIVIADNCAPLVNQIFENHQHESSSTLLLGGFYFTMQIYGDFSGYSDIAIGCAKLFGIDLMNNFDRPYLSKNIAEFWRRWHISLMTWFRDYIYFPLGGSRVPKIKVIRNTFIIFLISGLWHGANWTFIVWGLYHAVLSIPRILRGKGTKVKDVNQTLQVLKVIRTFFFVLIGWIIFRADSITIAKNYIIRMFSFITVENQYLVTITDYKVLLFTFMMLLLDWLFRKEPFTLSISNSSDKKKVLYYYSKCRWLVYFSFVVLIYFFAGSQGQFIYFQF